MKNVFVGGGCGFIGSHLVRKLLETGVERVVVVDDESSGNRSMLPDDPRVEFHCYDLKFRGALAELMPGCDTVFHLAANPDISRAATHPEIDFVSGTMITNAVLESARIHGIKRIIYTSGSGVYGDHGLDVVGERTECRPISTYGASKLASEAMICSYCHMFGMEGRAFRFANVVGPRQTHGVGFDFMRRLREDQTKLKILGDGEQKKSYIYIDDVLDAVFTVLDKPTPGFDAFNVATGDYITVREIAMLAIEASGLDPEKVELEFTGGKRGWSGDVPTVRFDCTKITIGYGWRRKLSAKAAIQKSLQSL